MMEGDGGAMEQVPMRLDACPRDLLRTFMSGKELDMSDRGAEGTAVDSEEEEEEEEEIELNLGLSLGGRFGIDKSSKTKLLVRSSSVSSFMHPLADSGFGIDGDAADPSPSLSSAAAYAGLVRTSSLPVETEEEWRKRKELQTLRRLAAKRRRSEKQRNSRGDRDAAAGGGGGSDGDRSLEEEKNEIKCVQLATHGGLSLMDAAAALPVGLSAWSSAAAISRSAESQGGSSSAASESDCKQPVQGSSGWGEEKISASIQLVQEQSYKEAVGSSAIRTRASPCRSVEADNSSKKLDRAENGGREIGMNAMQDMPCVFTTGDGPNGRRIEGILYKYGKGQEVRIMCVCHGKFLSPAEFVKHAGGSDVAHPLKHIVVNPPASFSSVL